MLIAGHAKFLKLHEHEFAEELDRSGRAGVDYARKNPRFKPRTGKTQAANDYKIIRTKTRGKVRLYNTAKHAAALDRGARPHIIRAKNKSLAFKGRSGEMVFRRSVRHPGNKPYRFLYGATIAAGRSFHGNMQQRMSRIANRF